MFNIECLKKSPLILQIQDLKKELFQPPDPEDVSASDVMLKAIKNDKIDTIYACMSRPWVDYIAFKVLYRNTEFPCSLIIYKPDLCLLKKIWDLGHNDFNKALIFYCKYSSDFIHQYAKKAYYPQNSDCYEWYMQIILGNMDKNV